MSLNESIVEDAAHEWFGALGYAVGHRPDFSTAEPSAERDSYREVVLAGRLRAAIRRLLLVNRQAWTDNLSRMMAVAITTATVNSETISSGSSHLL